MSTAVIGAGIAGLSAAASLKAKGEQVFVLEAKDRLGGRTHTDRSFADIPVEFGAEFIHGDQVATWELIRDLDLPTLHWTKTEDSLVRLEDGAWLTMAEARASRPDFELTRSWDLPPVEPLANEDWHGYLTRIGFSAEQLRYVRRSFANACGENMRFLSARAVLELLRDRGGESGLGDYRLMSGYDALVAHLAQGLEVHTNNPVTHIDWSPEGVAVRVLSGETFEADACVVAVPLGVLQAGIIDFCPTLPDAKCAALKGLRMGAVVKLIYKFAGPIVAPDIMAIYSRYNPPMWWSPSFGHDTDETVWTAFVSGSWAVDLLSLGEEGALEAALTSLRRELDRPDLETTACRLVNWLDDPHVRGGYSFVLPGHGGARARLAAPMPPLYWAGEATEPEHRAATVHGALLSGRRAAAEVLSYEGEVVAPIAEHLIRPAPRTATHSPAEDEPIPKP